jgi:hypothetical protein
MDGKDRKYIPEFLRGRFELIGTVTFTLLFAVLYLLVSIPFSKNAWFRLGNSVFFGFTALFVLGCLVIVILSRVIMYHTRNRFKMKYWHYIVWCIGEIVVICVLYTLLTTLIAQPEDMSPVWVFLHSLQYGAMCLAVPYVLAAMFLTIIHQERTIRLMNMREVVTDEPLPASEQKITLFDNSGALKLSVSSDNLYYIESDDNYIKVWYTDGKGELKTYMLRCRLKTVEESFLGSDLVRCHRKFIVNMAKVTLLRKERDGYLLDLDNDRIAPIPVTKTYAAQVLSRFSEGMTDGAE